MCRLEVPPACAFREELTILQSDLYSPSAVVDYGLFVKNLFSSGFHCLCHFAQLPISHSLKCNLQNFPFHSFRIPPPGGRSSANKANYPMQDLRTSWWPICLISADGRL